jgi:hypothetical protein
MPSVCNDGYNSLVFFIVTTCFGLTGHLRVVRVVVIKESTAHCNAVLFLLSSCLELLLGMGVNRLFYLRVLELHSLSNQLCLLTPLTD